MVKNERMVNVKYQIKHQLQLVAEMNVKTLILQRGIQSSVMGDSD
jgi:hypothetical protein